MIKMMPFLKEITNKGTKEQIIFLFKNVALEKGRYLCEEGPIGDRIWVLDSGRVSIQKKYLNQQNIYYQDFN